MAKIELNTVAPNFTLLDYEGNSYKLSQHKGTKNILLVFNRGFA